MPHGTINKFKLEVNHKPASRPAMSDEEIDFIDGEDASEVALDNQLLEDDLEEVDLSEEMELVDQSAVSFTEHKGSVFSVSCVGGLACSGGEDDKAFLWRLSDGGTVFQCQGHKDSVSCTGFSADGRYVATGDMGGLVQVWGVADGEKVWSFETGDLEWLRWHPLAHVLLAGTSGGEGWMWKIPSGDCKTFQGHNSRNTCSAMLPNGKSACFGYEDGSVKVWDLKEGSPLVTMAPPHTEAVTCMAAHHDGKLLISGSADTTAKLTTINSGKVVATLGAGFPRGQDSVPSALAEDGSVECVAFTPTLPLAVSGSLSGAMAVWDLPTQQLRLVCQHEAGVVRLACSRQSPLVYSGCVDGVLRGWDLRSGECVGEWHGHTDTVLDMTLTEDEKYLVSAADDETCKVFSISQS